MSQSQAQSQPEDKLKGKALFMVFTAYLSAIDPDSERYIKEHHVARYVILLIQLIFPLDTWAIVPQKYLTSQRTSDLVLESYGPGVGNPVGSFIPKAYFEFKSPSNGSVEVAFTQAKKVLLNEQGPALKDKGYIFGISGSKLIVADFNMFKTDNRDTQGRQIVDCMTFPINRTHGLIDTDPEAPQLPNKNVLDFKEDLDLII